MRKLYVLASAALLAASGVSVSGPALAEDQVPEDCAVPDFIDLSKYNIIIGTDDSELIRGTPAPDFICARLGDDTILSYGGADLVLGDTTTFFGNPGAAGGNDVVVAGSGWDEVLPGPGDDRVMAGRGRDFVALAIGDDVGYGGAGRDDIIGGFGFDVIEGGHKADSLAGGPDDDTLLGGRGNDTLAGELPPGTEPPPGVPLPPPATRDVCVGSVGIDTAIDCDFTVSTER